MRGKGTLIIISYGPEHTFFYLTLYPEKIPGVIRAAAQYGVASRLVDLSVFDLTHHPWRCGGLFDAIVTDPPCSSGLFIRCFIYLWNIRRRCTSRR